MVQIDIEMPIYCYDCPCHNGENGRCNITGDSTYDKRPFDCPLKDVKLTDLPSAQSERKKGKWIKMSDADGIYYACSECGENIPRVPQFNPQFDLFPRLKSLEKTNFCHMCGADNREENKNERTGG